MTRMPRQQRGLTMISIIFIAGFIMFLVLTASKLIPTYIEAHSIRGIIASLKEDVQIKRKSAAEIKIILLKKFKINSIYGFDKKAIKVKKKDNKITVQIAYEKRVKMVGNLDAAMTFNNWMEF